MPRVLLVEDSPMQARVVTGSLENGEYEVDCVERLNEAVELALGGRFEAIILDLSLPDSDGLNTYLRMQEAAPSTPIVVLTSTDDEELAIQMLRSGAQDYLIKDRVTSEWIVRSIRYAVERFNAARSKMAQPEAVASDRALNLEVVSRDDITVLRVLEKQMFGDDLIEQLSSRFFKLVDEDGRRKIVLNCERVDYLSNSVLGQFLVWDKKIRQHGGSLRICNLRREVQDQIKARKLLAQFDICIDEPTALQGF